MITLFTNHWNHANQERQEEIDYCINKNIENPFIDRVVILGQSSEEKRKGISSSEILRYISKFRVKIKGYKVIWENVDCTGYMYNRPTYELFFKMADKYCTSPADISIISNSDIYFDETIGLIKDLDLSNTCIALTRHEVYEENLSAMEIGGAHSQDTWIVQGKPLILESSDWPMGIWQCDSKIAYELENAGYRLINPCYSIISHHLHHNSDVGDRGNPLPGKTQIVNFSKIEDCGLKARILSKVGIISFSLFGSSPKYCQGAIQNMKLAKHIYPGWAVRFYYDDTVPHQIIDTLHSLGADLVKMPRSIGVSGAFWRLLVADDLRYDRWLVRDVDSRLNYRERVAVDDWIASGLPFHAMLDHPDHHGHPIVCCAFDGLSGRLSIGDAIDKWDVDGVYGGDENFLEEIIWPRIKDKTLVHDGYNLSHKWGGIYRPFPTKREFGRFVGEVFDENECCHAVNRHRIMNYIDL
ncbi:MAG: hypothetical protein M0R50_03190 [Candidatus Cloacimonetes bacterium]|jgi:hypothetical protein|nr:hypothetical protein [Candidatus Cloacimonadota bacterium]